MTTLMIRLMVLVKSPSAWPFVGFAKSILCPSCKSPRESSWLFMYSEAVRKFPVSIMIYAARGKRDKIEIPCHAFEYL